MNSSKQAQAATGSQALGWQRLTGTNAANPCSCNGKIIAHGDEIGPAARCNRAGLAACLLLVGSVGTQRAVALGDTRTLTLHHVHTDESLTIAFKKNGQYAD